jgi:hypothetical protein
MADPDLKPCPFCGREPRWIDDDGEGNCMVFCPGEYSGCEAAPSVFMPLDKVAECIAAWNMRQGVGLREALEAFVGAAMYDAMMDGPRFKGWNRSELDRALVKAHAALRRAPGPQPASTNPKIIRTDVDAQALVNTLDAARVMLAALKALCTHGYHLPRAEDWEAARAAIAQAEAAGIKTGEVK